MSAGIISPRRPEVGHSEASKHVFRNVKNQGKHEGTTMTSRAGVNCVRGIKSGLLTASVFSGLTIVYSFTSRGDLLLANLRVTLPEVVLGYLVSGVIIGGIAGALRWMAKSRIGAAAVGVIAFLPVAGGVAYFVLLPRGIPLMPSVLLALILALCFGIGGGLVEYQVSSGTRPTDRDANL
jgi:hypothetical protein